MSENPASATYAAAWDAWTARLTQRLLELADDGTPLVVTAPEPAARPRQTRPRRAFGLVPARYEACAPYVMLRRAEDHLRGECIGAAAFGSGFPLSPDEERALVEIGWRRPGLGDGTGYLRWWPDDVATAPFLPPELARRAAEMTGATMRDVFAVEDPATLVLNPT